MEGVNILGFSVKCRFICKIELYVLFPCCIYIEAVNEFIYQMEGFCLYLMSSYQIISRFNFIHIFLKIELTAYVAQVVLEFPLLLSHPLHCWDYSHVSPGLFLHILAYLPK
jgi:hypothetical protein